jgi:heptosyltransferase-2
MKILIELPTWLGDAVMTTPAIENLIYHFKKSEITLLGSFASIEVLKNHPKIVATHIIDTNIFNLYKDLKAIGSFDFFFSFRSSLRSKYISFCVISSQKYQYHKKKFPKGHQVEKYNNFVNVSLQVSNISKRLILHSQKTNKSSTNKLLGINPGASYGSAKRWYPKEFARVAIDLSNQYDIIIFGGLGEVDIAEEIEFFLIDSGVKNYQNLAAKTTISELITQIQNLDLFITGDSGPMHLAAAFQVPTISIFGPTKDNETSQWMNEKSIIVKKNLECQPCMQRSCPLNHHNCMKKVKASDVLDAVMMIT